MNILFVCTLNKARSVTAERMYRRTPGISVRSAGISDRAVHHITEADLAWADRIIVFEPAQEQWIRNTFSGDLPEIVDVGIPDDYVVGDSELVAELTDVLPSVLGHPPRMP